jgi:biopolymer transport protein ExbB/TolQ
VQDFLPMLTQASKTLVSIVMRGGLVMIPLLTASVVAMTVILERLFCWRRLRVRRGEPGILALVAEGDLPQAMQAAAQVEVGQARRYLPILDTVIAVDRHYDPDPL